MLMTDDYLGLTCQFLSTLLCLNGSNTVPSSERKLLVSKLRTWKKKYRLSQFASDTIGRCIDQLEPKGCA